MKALICDAPGRMRLFDAEAPRPKAGEALVRIRKVGVCGTDLHIYGGDNPYVQYPRILGHELAGEVVDPGGSDLKPGDPVAIDPYTECGRCVACRRGRTNCCANLQIVGVQLDGGMRELLAVRADHLLPAHGLTFEQIALVECLTIGAHAARRAQVEKGEWALVIGAGPIGLGCLQFARLAGARVIAMDTRDSRLDFARDALRVEHRVRADAPDALDRVLEICGGEPPTLVYDATGSARAMERSFDFVAAGGRLIFAGVTKDAVSFAGPAFHKRELSILSSRNGTREDFAAVIEALRGGSIEGSCFVTHRSPLAQAAEAFAHWHRPESGVVKAMIEP